MDDQVSWVSHWYTGFLVSVYSYLDIRPPFVVVKKLGL